MHVLHYCEYWKSAEWGGEGFLHRHVNKQANTACLMDAAGVCLVMDGFLNKSSVTVLLAGDFQWRCFTNPNAPETCSSVNVAHAPSTERSACIHKWCRDTFSLIRNNPFERTSLSIIYSSSVTPLTFSRLFCHCVASDPTHAEPNLHKHACEVFASSVREGRSGRLELGGCPEDKH